MSIDKELQSIFSLIKNIKERYRESISTEDGEQTLDVYLKSPPKANVGDFWFCTDSNRLLICYGVINGVAKWRNID